MDLSQVTAMIEEVGSRTMIMAEEIDAMDPRVFADPTYLRSQVALIAINLSSLAMATNVLSAIIQDARETGRL